MESPLPKSTPANPARLAVSPLRSALLCLEGQLVGVLALREAPACPEVLGEVLGLLDRGNDGRVNSLLVGSLGLGERLLGLGLALSEELLLRRALALGGSLGEVSVVDLLVDLIAFCV